MGEDTMEGVWMSSKDKRGATLYNPRTCSFEEWREFMRVFITHNPASSPAWDVMTALRGPDAPSERAGQPPKAYSAAYKGRRDRKFKTVEVIRSAAFYSAVGGCARQHTGDTVVVSKQEDHFDRHVRRAAAQLGLKVEVEP